MTGNAGAAMLCPADRTPLTMSERQGIEIDFCPACRGVWLDRGELDKIIERNAPAAPPPRGVETVRPPSGFYGDDDGHYRHGHGRRRKSFLSELFD
jgi:Zn-finger nucleic acid-binding protein